MTEICNGCGQPLAHRTYDQLYACSRIAAYRLIYANPMPLPTNGREYHRRRKTR